MEFLQTLLDQSEMPVVTAFLLGLLTAVSPCPLATNITAIGFISKEMDNRGRVFRNGILYTVGRILAYSVLGAVLIFIIRRGLDIFYVQKLVSQWGNYLLPPVLILVGIFILVGDKLPLPKIGIGTEKFERLRGAGGSFILGLLFALTFCPTSGLFYFGMLIPMSAAEEGGYLLPVVFALSTGIPVVLAGWFLAYSISRIGQFYSRLQVFRKWFGYIVAMLFIATGFYYGFINIQ